MDPHATHDHDAAPAAPASGLRLPLPGQYALVDDMGFVVAATARREDAEALRAVRASEGLEGAVVGVLQPHHRWLPVTRQGRLATALVGAALGVALGAAAVALLRGRRPA